MKDFARLIERIAFTPSRNAKLTLLQDYLARTADPDRGWAMAALTGALELRNISRSFLQGLMTERVDPILFALSYDFVGDLAETISLIWPTTAPSEEVSLSEAVQLLQLSGRARGGRELAAMLDRLTPSERLAFLKLGTGNMRIGLSARMVQLALAQMGSRQIEEIEEIWHGLVPPYQGLFDWLAGGAPPALALSAPFRPVMLSTAVTLEELDGYRPEDYHAEWKWDGIRVQVVSEAGERRLYSRTGEEISGSFPEIIEAMQFDGVLDGELLVKRGPEVAPFADLQRRLGRKTVSAAQLKSHPAAIRVYDLLLWQGEDLRALPLSERRARLEQIDFGSERFDLSPLLSFQTWEDIARLRDTPPDPVIEGVMLKQKTSAYLAGRPRGPWFKWKRAPRNVDAVLLYAQSGHGKRSGFYSDFTFGLWEGGELLPVGKAYFGFTDAELRELDRFVRKNTTQRFGPVRQVKPLLVLEVAFDGVNVSARHKSGVAMRFPRISRIRWDKPAAEADQLSTLKAML